MIKKLTSSHCCDCVDKVNEIIDNINKEEIKEDRISKAREEFVDLDDDMSMDSDFREAIERHCPFI